jgi:hypothetical protein
MAGAAASLASPFDSFLAACFGSAAGVAAGAAAAVASAPHCALRKSFHDWPPSVPAVFAAWYLALHSCGVSALACEVIASAARPDIAIAPNILA